jgi:UDP-2,3-diacylglucosamine pyrophosphatase LpxH
MKVAIITDQHFGARKNSKMFHEHFLKFYENVFFPTLESEGIATVIDMGDTFDSRKGIDFSALAWAKNHYYDKLQEMGVKVHTIVGNHTAYYKNTNEINAVDLLLREYSNITVYSNPTEIKIGNLDVLLLPWINEENEKETYSLIETTSCICAMGHLEFSGFRVNSQIVMEHGLSSKLFKKFKRVYSGHYHTRSNDGKIFYLGNPYEIYWTDVYDKRGFTIFDTETLKHQSIDNPYNIFEIVYYGEDTTPIENNDYENKIVKVIVKQKDNQLKFEKFLDNLYSQNPAEVKIVENFEINIKDFEEDIESEDTVSILDRYIQDSEIDMDKSKIRSIIREIYKESCEMI